MEPVSSEQEARAIYDAARRIAPLELEDGGSAITCSKSNVQVGGPTTIDDGCIRPVPPQSPVDSDETLQHDGIWREKKPKPTIRRRLQQLQDSMESFRQNGLLK